MDEIHLTKKDFRVEWFSGTGKGGQHRNKHQNCCRIIHLESGLRAQGTEARERQTNQRNAFNRLVRRVVAWYEESPERFKAQEVIRNYHEPRNEVLDKASGARFPYRQVLDGDIGGLIDARRQALMIRQEE